jgi:hypothetical protein
MPSSWRRSVEIFSWAGVRLTFAENVLFPARHSPTGGQVSAGGDGDGAGTGGFPVKKIIPATRITATTAMSTMLLTGGWDEVILPDMSSEGV